MPKDETTPCVFHRMPSGCLHGDKREYLHESKKPAESQPKAKAQPEARPVAKAKALASVAIVAMASALAGCGLEFVADSQALINQGISSELIGECTQSTSHPLKFTLEEGAGTQTTA